MPHRAFFPLCFAVQLGAALHADCVPGSLPAQLANGGDRLHPAVARSASPPAPRAPIARRDAPGSSRAPTSAHREPAAPGARVTTAR